MASEKIRMNTYLTPTYGGPFVKIGKSTNVENRMSGIATGCPFKIELAHTVPADCEQELHSELGRYRVTGEWFFTCPESLKILSNVTTESCVNKIVEVNSTYKTDRMGEIPGYAERVGGIYDKFYTAYRCADLVYRFDHNQKYGECSLSTSLAALARICILCGIFCEEKKSAYTLDHLMRIGEIAKDAYNREDSNSFNGTNANKYFSQMALLCEVLAPDKAAFAGSVECGLERVRADLGKLQLDMYASALDRLKGRAAG